MAAEFTKFIQFAKLEENSSGEPTVWGIATLEAPDLDREICRYATAKPVYQAWSAAAAERTGKSGADLSLGNIRRQHSMEPAGKATKLEFDDAGRRILLGSEPISEQIHKELKGGFLTGYSQGGAYAARECAECDSAMPMSQGANYCKKCGKDVDVFYDLASLSEVSYVDSPCTGEGFESVKANGSREIVKFAKKKEAPAPPPDATGDGGNVKKLREFIAERIAEKATSRGLEKGMYAVGRFAELLESIQCLYQNSAWERDYEQDGSEVPEELLENLDSLIETFLAMAEEEAKELAARKADNPTTTKGDVMSEQNEELLKAANKSFAKHFAKSAAHHTKVAKAHEAKAEHHEELSKLHKAAHEAHKAADVSGGEAGDGEGYGKAVEGQIEFHKGAEKCHKGIAAEHIKCAKAHEDHAEHCTKMAESHDKEEAEKAAKEFGAPVTKADTTTQAAAPTESEFERKAIAKAQADLLSDADFMADVKKRQREMLLNKFAVEGLSNVVEPTATKSAASTPILRAGQSYDFAKASGPSENDCGI